VADKLAHSTGKYARMAALMLILGGGITSLEGCKTPEVVKPIDPVNIFKDYVISPKDGEFYINIKDIKVDINGALSFKVKENVTQGTKEVTLQFDAGKLRVALEKVFEGINAKYSGIQDKSLRLQFATVNDIGNETEF
jgi:hypothetical protein